MKRALSLTVIFTVIFLAGFANNIEAKGQVKTSKKTFTINKSFHPIPPIRHKTTTNDSFHPIPPIKYGTMVMSFHPIPPIRNNMISNFLYNAAIYLLK